ncbi:MAG TPA: LLM class flavin-dependent oxidoreductase [Candidatus Poseidoniales archaeon]|nr:MAG: luciferase [Euryarchaeota archaeon]HHZ74560.1 LLM class flavin-dependent oxidoreductase [Candidatus Poseidoniales archaeon]HIB24059.1 LLM class flavin-dependent oxidoreductase [Candidatus Poseidoniales archaeon]HIO86801.1 LLM class flavin-dependent oxidoreductase [Candidatus Poseidoniales archaeon]
MEFDVFFSISQTPDSTGYCPDEQTMYSNYIEQLKVADNLGYGVAWIAQAHLSTEVQKRNQNPVIPHWEGEVGLCTDFFQLAALSFAETKQIEVGSAVLSILANGGPIAVAERVGNFCALQELRGDSRKLHIGYSAGRFQFMASPYGVIPRDAVEQSAWPALRGQIFWEASEIFLRLLNGEAFSSDSVRKTILSRDTFRTDEDWQAVQETAIDVEGLAEPPQEIEIPNHYQFEEIKCIPQNWNRDLLSLTLGSHEPALQIEANKYRPVQVFNLSITAPELIEATHDRMTESYHESGGGWQRNMMPRTIMVFLNNEEKLTPEERSTAAQKEAKATLDSYWNALEGTIDPAKVSKAANNAVIGNAEEVAAQIVERFHPDDRLMLWFDFFRHDSARVQRDMVAFMNEVVPLVNGDE